MILKKVKIYNYRQLQKVELDLQNSLTVLAGPNNSGKTTLISVLKGMFRDKKLSFTYSDIPTNLSTSWVEKIIPVFQSIMVENDKNTGISEIIKKITIPNNRNDETDSEFSIRQIVAASSNNKTDFMYSVVLSGNEEKMLPDYIRKGLLWLAK